MFPPVPAPFQGSAPEGPLPYFDLPWMIERVFAGLAVGMAGLVCAAYAGGRPEIDWASMAKLGCFALLMVAAAGLWLMEHAAEVPHSFAPTCWAVMQERLSAEFRGTPDAASAEGPVKAWFGLLAEGASRLRRLQASRAQLRAEAESASRTLQAGRDGARHLARLLRSDGASLADAASLIMADSARLADGTAATLTSAAATERDVTAAIDGATQLASAAHATTAEIGRMASGAVRAAESAFAAQRGVAALDAQTAALADAADQIGHAMRAAVAHEAGPGEVSALAEAIEAQLARMQTTAAELRVGTGEATARVRELSELIETQHALGQALANALAQQGMEIGTIVEHLSGACAGLAILRAGVDAVTSSSTSRLAGAEALRGAADRLPRHADTIAELLRSTPDYAPGLEF